MIGWKLPSRGSHDHTSHHCSSDMSLLNWWLVFMISNYHMYRILLPMNFPIVSMENITIKEKTKEVGQ